MRQILESHPIANLKKEVGKLKKSLNYSKLNKKELIDLMMKPNLRDNFKHIKMYVKPERKKPAPKAKPAPKPKPAPKAKEESKPTGILDEFREFVKGNNKFNKKIEELTKDKNLTREQRVAKRRRLKGDEFDEFLKIVRKLQLSDLPINISTLFKNNIDKVKNSLIKDFLMEQDSPQTVKSNQKLTITRENQKTNLKSLLNKEGRDAPLLKIHRLYKKVVNLRYDGKNATNEIKELKKLIRNYNGFYRLDKDSYLTVSGFGDQKPIPAGLEKMLDDKIFGIGSTNNRIIRGEDVNQLK